MSDEQDQPGFRPLYAKARDTLLERIRSGVWRPGQAIPNEFEIAAELGVSQGTARKALDALAGAGLLVRRQGRGTFVVEHTPDDVLFRFFHFYQDDGRPVRPDSTSVRCIRRTGTAEELAALALADGAPVLLIERVRTRDGRPFITEAIVLPAELFADLGNSAPIPNTLYDLFQKKFGVLVGRADERITAVAASPADAAVLGVAEGAPLLRIARIAFDIDDRPIELRTSICRLDGLHYLARLK
ncbi:MAG: GntR family transcriptional regulator [Hyphomicrobiales bacterium]|nr:GntR family transcriptional regulator [Hyphomicrobiales bacterium]